MLTPYEFGLPAKYREWRAGQLAAVDQIVETDSRFIIICAPTGFGKSLAYMAAAKMSNLRTVVCTSTKGLQDQLQADFQAIGQDIRGMENYPCVAAAEFGYKSKLSVAEGPCHSGAGCNHKINGKCGYYADYAKARRAGIVTTNYALWMHDGLKEEHLGAERNVDMLVLDEAHDAPEALASFVGTELAYRDINKVGLQWLGDEESQETWRAWGRDAAARLQDMVEDLTEIVRSGRATQQDIRRIQEWKRLRRKVVKVAGMRGEWAIEPLKVGWEVEHYGPRVRFDPLWPKDYAESALFRGVKRIVFVSATVRPKTASLLGVEDHIFREFASTFPLARRPVIHVPTVQMNWRMSDVDLMWWMQKIDGLLDQRQDRKGIIHTVSYQRAQLILLNSRHKSRMLCHDSRNRALVVEKFKSADGPWILVSPSVDTGYDFPYRECEFQIISKVPFQDNRGKVVKARVAADKQYSNYMTAQTIVQMTGRGMRAVDDQCETIIVDNNIQWFVGQNRQHFPKWWLESYRTSAGNPEPLSPLPRL